MVLGALGFLFMLICIRVGVTALGGILKFVFGVDDKEK